MDAKEKPVSYGTRARVRLVIEFDTGGDAWSEEEPAYKRAFREAKERALNRLNNMFSRMTDAEQRSLSIKVTAVEVVELVVVEGKPT